MSDLSDLHGIYPTSLRWSAESGFLAVSGSRRGGGWNWVGVVSGLFNPNDSGVGALERRPRHDEGYHEGGGCGRRSFAFG